MERITAQFSFIILLVLCISQATFPGNRANGARPTSMAKTETNDVYHPMLINNIFNYYANNGGGSFNPFSISSEGFEFPKGKNLATVIFEDGVVWGCFKQGTLHVGGSTYWHGLQAGPIISPGTSSTLPVAGDPGATVNRLYRVRRDIPPIPNVTNPDDPAAAGELTIIQNSEVPLISRYESGVTAEQILQQYWNDWNTWPAAQGALYTDLDHNGAYDPTIDIPGVPLSDQTMWYVANDLDASRVLTLCGSTPIGLEMQRTIWAFNRGGALGDAIFSSTRLINKSGVELDSMFVGQWSDPDLGNPGDDYVGCDTVLSLEYDYNATPIDSYFQTYGLVPPAVGYHFFQGPMVPGAATDTAIFELKYRPGFKNLPMTAFNFFINSNAIYSDPEGGNVSSNNGTIQWYHLLNGLVGNSGDQYINPTTGQPTKFIFSGDPVTSTGWIDGALAPADRRIAMSSGPFTMMPGDTQEVVVACLAARGTDYLSSITALKANVRIAQQVYKDLFSELPPEISCSVKTAGSQATISFVADARLINASAVTINIKTYNDSLVAIVPLADDGLHNDGGTGDKVFGKSVQIPQLQVGLYAEANVLYPNGNVVSWARIVENITTTSISVPSYSVASDNINEDGTPNPGENVRYVFSLKNNSSFGFSNLMISADPAFPFQLLNVAALGSDATFPFSYDQNNPATYLSFDVPKNYRDSTIRIVLTISDLINNQWVDTLVFPAKALGYNLYGSPLTHVSGTALGNFAVWIVDSAEVTNHLYVIRGVDSIAPGPISGYTLKDSTAGNILIQNHPLPDVLGHTSPIVDGFKLVLGSLDTLSGMKSWSIPSGTRRFDPVGGFTGVGLEGFSSTTDTTAYNQNAGTIGMSAHFTVGGTTLKQPSQYHNVLLTLAAVNTGSALWNPTSTPADTNFSRAYRYVRHASLPPADTSFAKWITNTSHPAGGFYLYQDYNYAVPFSAWDMETNPPTRLSVGCLESNDAGASVDGRYWPPVANGLNNSISRELCFIFAKPYTTTADPSFNVDILYNSTLPMMWAITCNRRDDNPWVAGDQFEIIANHLPSSQDVWTFSPSVLTNVRQASSPYSFMLMQNYPNPFNPSTTIRYELPALSKVKITIYNVLGQKVRTLVNGVQNAGPQFQLWDSKNDAGRNVASGVYFYRIEAAAITGASSAFSITKKMMLIK